MRDRIVADIKRLAEKLGKPPTLEQLHRECRISWHQVYKSFGGMRGAIRAAGMEPGFRGGALLDERSLVLDWARVVREMGRLPQRTEYSARGRHHAATLHDRVGWQQVAHRFVLLLREFHIETEWRDVAEIVLRKYPLLEQSLYGSAIGSQSRDIQAADRRNRVIPPQPAQNRRDPGAPVIGRSGDLVIGTTGPISRELTRMDANQGMKLGRVVAAALAMEILFAAEKHLQPQGTQRHTEAEGQFAIEKEALASRGQARVPVYGEPLALAAMAHAPVNEDGVLFLFGAVAADMGFRIERVQRGFPDVEAKREVAPGIWELQFWELEYCSRNFKEHKHDPKGCHGIICWKHNWPDVPEGLEVIELSRVVKGR
ncbi:MAG TPA: hypothetical protein VFR84_10145 [Candidatus Angelobacter sp.]|nr:hypothetical protein [Candidatus Angelobacter sp.]